MEPLSATLEDPLFRYDQVEREGMLSLYRQTHKPSGNARFEVIRIRVRAAHTWPNGDTTPAHEAYPGAKAWGKDGWTFFALGEAQEALREQAKQGAPICQPE